MDYRITPPAASLDAALRRKFGHKTKPPGSLGRLEALALQIGRVRGSLTPTLDKPLAVLARYGGFEIAMMAGAMLAAAQRRMLMLVDGFICGAAALVAALAWPLVRVACAFLNEMASFESAGVSQQAD